MCGIVLEYHKKSNSNISTFPVAKMLDTIHHRGYDQVTINQHGNLCIGFRRLAITNLSSNQPGIANGWSVYLNGEIYNYDELGYTGNECEVIAKGLAEHGEYFVQKLNGMFLIVAINGDQVYVFRDRYGIKPAYY